MPIMGTGLVSISRVRWYTVDWHYLCGKRTLQSLENGITDMCGVSWPVGNEDAIKVVRNLVDWVVERKHRHADRSSLAKEGLGNNRRESVTLLLVRPMLAKCFPLHHNQSRQRVSRQGRKHGKELWC